MGSAAPFGVETTSPLARMAATVTSCTSTRNGESLTIRGLIPPAGPGRRSAFPIQTTPPGTHASSGPGVAVQGTLLASGQRSSGAGGEPPASMG